MQFTKCFFTYLCLLYCRDETGVLITQVIYPVISQMNIQIFSTKTRVFDFDNGVTVADI